MVKTLRLSLMSVVCVRHVSDWATQSVMATSLFREYMKVWDTAVHQVSTGLSDKLPACRHQPFLSRPRWKRCSGAEANVVLCDVILLMLSFCCERDDRQLCFIICRRTSGVRLKWRCLVVIYLTLNAHS